MEQGEWCNINFICWIICFDYSQKILVVVLLFSGIYWRAISYFKTFLFPARKEIRNNLFYKIRERVRQIILTMGMFFSRKNVFMMKSNCGSNWTCLPAIHSGSISFLSRTQLVSFAKTPSHILCNVLIFSYRAYTTHCHSCTVWSIHHVEHDSMSYMK